MRTSITVIEKITTETPANVSVFDSTSLRATPGVNLDDRLRDLPGFTLFRRSSSLVAHPTTQGISLRGLGSTGASRTLVLWDGVPVNDPFGGWVYWTRIPPQDVERVEVSRGASTSIFGDRAMGGAIAIFSPQIEGTEYTARYEAGNYNTHDASAGYSRLWHRWAISGTGRAFSTDGYYTVPEASRGAIDQPAGVRFVTGAVKVDWFRAADRLAFKADLLAEERQNGTPLQTNSTGLGQVSLHYLRESGANGISILGFHTREQFHSVFSAIAADRASERLTFRQRVPSEDEGGAGMYRRAAKRWHLVAGADAVRVEGYSIDSLVPSGQRLGGGTLFERGVFGQSDLSLGPVTVFAGVRQHWPGRGSSLFTPSAGLAAGKGRLRARASAYRAFRAPTLNELYREFRAGNAVTRANDALSPERLTGVEAGLDFLSPSGAVRFTAFRNSLRDLITNVTLSSAPNLIVRQRQNAAEALSRGFELAASRRLGRWRAEAAYLYVDSHFGTGERIPQVSPHQGSARVLYSTRDMLLSLGIRSYAAQFEDDRNQFLLPGFATVQAMARRRLVRQFSALLSLENALNRSYLAGFSPTPISGTPRLWRLGVVWGSPMP